MVEDTVARILRASGASGAEVVVMATGIFITLTSGEGEPLSVVRRVRGRSTNMNRICRVNDVSRNFCTGILSVEEGKGRPAGDREGASVQPKTENPGIYRYSAAFAVIFDGGILEIAGGSYGGHGDGLV